MGAEDAAAGWYNIRMVKHVILWKLKDEVADKAAVYANPPLFGLRGVTLTPTC